jgi:hypothetical protein
MVCGGVPGHLLLELGQQAILEALGIGHDGLPVYAGRWVLPDGDAGGAAGSGDSVAARSV